MDAYQNSIAVAKLRQAKEQGQPLRLALLDIDGTWGGSPAEQTAVYELLEKNHYVAGQVTSRTEGFLNPDILISVSGTQIFLKQPNNSYELDQTYAQRLPQSVEDWHARVDQLLSQTGLPQESYTVQRIDRAYYRVEIALEGKEAADQMITTLRGLDSESIFNFARETRNFFITPSRTNKKEGVDHVTTTLLQQLNTSAQEVSVLLAGDTAIEVPMGFEGARGTRAIFIIPGGAALSQEMSAGIFSELSQKMTKSQNSGTLPEGVYWFPDTNRNIVIGDEAFPGTIGPQTLIAWLQQHP